MLTARLRQCDRTRAVHPRTRDDARHYQQSEGRPTMTYVTRGAPATRLVAGLPATIPFVAPEALERRVLGVLEVIGLPPL